jgi:hypothetical protein
MFGYNRIRGTQSGGVPFEYVVFSRVTTLTIDVGANDPLDDVPTSFDIKPNDGTNSPFDSDNNDILLPELSLFDPISDATLGDDWIMIAENALQDDVGLGSLRLFMGAGHNYVSAIPLSSKTMVYPLCNGNASVLTTSSPLIPEYISLTTSSWPYADHSPFPSPNVDPLTSADVPYEASVDIAQWLPSIQTAFARLANLGGRSSIELAHRDPKIDILNTDVHVTSLLPPGVTMASLSDFTPMVIPSGPLTMNDMATLLQQHIETLVDNGDSNTTTVFLTPNIMRQGTNQGYSTRMDFGIIVEKVTLVTDVMSVPAPSLAAIFTGLNVGVTKGFDAYMDSAFVMNFTVIITDSGDVRLEVRHLCIETIAR